ncbi:MAG: hypothetical protein ACE5ES_00860 [Candidatus Nanoarchaeia archaeon]
MSELSKSRFFSAKCKVCRNSNVDKIEKDLLDGIPFNQIAEAYNDDAGKRIYKYEIMDHYYNHMGQIDLDKIEKLDNQVVSKALETITDFGRLYDNLDELGKHVFSVQTKTASEEFKKADTIVKISDLQLKIILAANKLREEDIRKASSKEKDISILFNKLRNKVD